MRVRWWVDGETTPKLAALIAEPDSVLGGPGSVAREPAGRKRLYRVDGGPGETPLLVKVFTLPPGLPRLRYLLRPSKARREAEIARRVSALGFETAGPIAVGEERRRGALVRSFSVIRELPARDLRAVLRAGGLDTRQRRDLLDDFAGFTRRLHESGVDQDDFSPNNFLVHPDGRSFLLIDFERCRVRGAPLGRRGLRLLAKLARREPDISRSDRLRFLHVYLGSNAGRAKRRQACARVRGDFRKIRRRDARRAGAAAFKAGRHLTREGEDWVVRARRDLPTIRLELSRERAREAWVRAHQLERLELPALRAVRLDAGGVTLAHPAPVPDPGEEERRAAIERARRSLALYGRFTKTPEWVMSPDGALLRDPLAFELDL